MNSLELPKILYQPFAATGDKNDILNSPSASEPQRANLQTGFPPVTQIPITNGGIPPERMDFNGLGYLLSSFYYFTQCGGVYTFNQEVSNAIGGYPQGAVLYYTASDGTMYKVKSLLENNTYNFVTNPEYIDDVKWAYVSSAPITQDTSANLESNVFSTAATHRLINKVDNRITNILNAIYPVGSIYLTTASAKWCPLQDLIPLSRWHTEAIDRALWGSGPDDAHTRIEPGLPNIFGQFGSGCLMNWQESQTMGSLYRGYQTSTPQNAGGTDGGTNSTISFDATRSNSIYGNSNTVQPPAYRVVVWRRFE